MAPTNVEPVAISRNVTEPEVVIDVKFIPVPADTEVTPELVVYPLGLVELYGVYPNAVVISFAVKAPHKGALFPATERKNQPVVAEVVGAKKVGLAFAAPFIVIVFAVKPLGLVLL